MTKKGKFALGVAVAFLVFCTVNFVDRLRPPTSFDFYAPRGIPFTYWHEGGIAGDWGFVWLGLLGDMLFTIVLGLIVGALLVRFAQEL
jgi:hypothetical protein